MAKFTETKKHIERVILVGVITKETTEEQVTEYLNELEFLAETAGAETIKHFTQKIEYPNPRTYVGSGKLFEIAEFIKANEIDIAIFDDELSPSQMRNIEKEFNIRILDRTNLILDIFAKRAQTAHAKTQVELAQYQYLLPRLTGLWTHLERQRGGIGLRGPGEKEIETDRRIIREQIAKLKEDLIKIDKQKTQQRKNRGKLVRISLVGYTNVGKSTLMNVLCKSSVFAENKLFATLDTTVRKIVIENLPVIIADTVGFIRKLPHHLVESFKSTLDEVRESDILLHIIDISHANYEEQIEVVQKTLSELNVADKTTLLVFNKIDNYQFITKDEYDLTEDGKEHLSLDALKKYWKAQNSNPCLFISAKNKENIDILKNTIFTEAKRIHTERYPYDDFLYSSDFQNFEEDL